MYNKISDKNKANNEANNEEDMLVISDMSEVKRHSFFSFTGFSYGNRLIKEKKNTNDSNYFSNENDVIELTKEEKKWYILGVLKASLLIGAIYAFGLSLVIIIFLLL